LMSARICAMDVAFPVAVTTNLPGVKHDLQYLRLSARACAHTHTSSRGD
jgi:hypothetical protein